MNTLKEILEDHIEQWNDAIAMWQDALNDDEENRARAQWLYYTDLTRTARKLIDLL
jgi:hypothetical protein